MRQRSNLSLHLLTGESMEWKDEFKHGLIWQDFQHKQLVDNINILINSVTTASNVDKSFKNAAYFTVNYCNGHFKIEEEYMKRHGYPLMDKHVKQHGSFIKKFNRIIKEKSLSDVEKSSELLHDLLDWFTDHIMAEDKYLANFLIRHEIDRPYR